MSWYVLHRHVNVLGHSFDKVTLRDFVVINRAASRRYRRPRFLGRALLHGLAQSPLCIAYVFMSGDGAVATTPSLEPAYLICAHAMARGISSDGRSTNCRKMVKMVIGGGGVLQRCLKALSHIVTHDGFGLRMQPTWLCVCSNGNSPMSLNKSPSSPLLAIPKLFRTMSFTLD